MGWKTVTLCFCFLMLFSGYGLAQYTYWVPYTNTTSGPSGGGSSVSAISGSDLNQLDADYNLDGVIDETVMLNQGQGWSHSNPPLGTRIYSVEPLQIRFFYNFSDHGTYEDGELRYAILPERGIGDDYWSPVDAPYSSVMAVVNGTTISYDSNGDGTPENIWNLNQGQAQSFSMAAGGHLWANEPFYAVAVGHLPSLYDSTFAFPLIPTNKLGNYYVSPAQHGYNHGSAIDQSGVHIVSVEDGVTVTIGVNQQQLDTGDVWFFQTASEVEISATGLIFAVYKSDVYGQDPWSSDWRHWDFAFVLNPAALNVKEIYTSSAGPTSHGAPRSQLFIASYTAANQVDFECPIGTLAYTAILNQGDTFYLHETDTLLSCWTSNRMRITSNAPIHGSYSRRGWWNSLSETTGAEGYVATFVACLLDADCDDGLWCNGEETCDLANNQCLPGTDPCVDDGLWCNGGESCDEDYDNCVSSGSPCSDDGLFCNGDVECDDYADECVDTPAPCPDDGEYCNGDESCDEDNDTCVSSGNPCIDDGLYCNGDSVCDEDADQCTNTGDPCHDDGLFCNGDESCDEDADQCVHSGDPCLDTEECNEDLDACEPLGETDDDDTTSDDDDQDLWPEGKVSGGSDECCGC